MKIDTELLSTVDLENERLFSYLYVEENCNKKDLAEIFDTYRQKIYDKIEEYGVQKVWENKELMEELYIEEEMSTIQIAEKYDTSQSHIYRWLKKHDIETRESTRKKPPHHYWDSRGYEIVSCDNGKNKKQVYIHRLVAVAEYGIEAVKENDVHHINGLEWDNRLSNIEVISRQEHGKIHREEQIAKGIN